MIAHPPGFVVKYNIVLIIDKLTDDIIEWFTSIGGESMVRSYGYNRNGTEIQETLVRYGNGKWSYRMSDGTRNVRIQFDVADAPIASMFLLKFSDCILDHNIRHNDLAAT